MIFTNKVTPTVGNYSPPGMTSKANLELNRSTKSGRKTTKSSSSLAAIMKSVVGEHPGDKTMQGKGKTAQRISNTKGKVVDSDVIMSPRDNETASPAAPSNENASKTTGTDKGDKVFWSAELGGVKGDSGSGSIAVFGNSTKDDREIKASDKESEELEEADFLVSFWQKEVLRLDNELSNLGTGKGTMIKQVEDKLASAQVMLKEALINLSLKERVQKLHQAKITHEQDTPKRGRDVTDTTEIESEGSHNNRIVLLDNTHDGDTNMDIAEVVDLSNTEERESVQNKRGTLKRPKVWRTTVKTRMTSWRQMM